MTSEHRVGVTITDRVAHVRLERPEKRNALDLPMFEALVAAGERLKRESGVRAVVLSGEGKGFCSGLDWPAFLALGAEASARLLAREGDAAANLAQAVCRVWTEVPVPVVAAVHGAAVGGGLQLALGADLRFVSPDAQLCIMELKYGLVPDMGFSTILPRLVRDDVARDLLFSARTVSGTEAVALGLATRVCDDPLAEALAYARMVAAKAPNALRAVKTLWNAAPGLSVRAALALETELQRTLLGQPEQMEAVMAAMQKREPVFEMSDDKKLYVPSKPLEPGDRYGVLSDFAPGTRTLPVGFQLAPPFRPLSVELVLEKDVAVTLRDGVTIYVDVLRPAGTDKVPVIVAWSPYGKGQGTSRSVMGVFGLVGLDNAILSGLAKFEGPDPDYWCARGYAVCNPDVRGVANSEGDSVLWDRQEGRDCYDLIEWLAAQPWCSGKVAMTGTSYLAVSQWFTAAEQPPHLAAINPWEGVSDVYRDLVMRGGMPDTAFAQLLQDNSFWGKGQKEDILTEAERYPLMSELWEHKIPRFEQITVPAYVVASYSNTLHTAGTFRAWRRMASEQKWLRVHNTQEWPDYYDEANREDLRRFFDHFLKGEDNGWDQTPRVRYSVLDLEGGDRVDVAASEFPPEDVALTKYYLDGRARTLTTAAPAHEATAAYAVGWNPDLVSFVTRFEHETVLVGYAKAHLWVEASGADDMDLFVLLQKLDAHGTPLQAFTVPNQSARMHDLTEQGSTILRYKGSDGRLRVSLRHLDAALSTEAVPAHSFDRVEKLSPGQVVEVELELLPLGLAFHPREQLRFVIGARNTLGPMMPALREYAPANRGQHVVHTGGARASYLQLPVQRGR